MTAVIVLLALVATELGVVTGLLMILVFLRGVHPGDRPPEGTVLPPAVPPTLENGKTGLTPEAESDEARRKTDDYEKRWREGMDSMMSYDLAAARRAVRNDADERID